MSQQTLRAIHVPSRLLNFLKTDGLLLLERHIIKNFESGHPRIGHLYQLRPLIRIQTQGFRQYYHLHQNQTPDDQLGVTANAPTSIPPSLGHKPTRSVSDETSTPPPPTTSTTYFPNLANPQQTTNNRAPQVIPLFLEDANDAQRAVAIDSTLMYDNDLKDREASRSTMAATEPLLFLLPPSPHRLLDDRIDNGMRDRPHRCQVVGRDLLWCRHP